jgi:O-antigen/teichoic acid export membrane protein
MTNWKRLRKPLIIIGIVTGAVATYGYQIAIARVLGPEAFGLLATLLALMGVIGIVSSALSPIAAQSSANQGAGGSAWKLSDDRLFTTSLVATAVLAVILTVLAIFFGQALRLGTVPLSLVSIYIPLAAVFAIGIGRMQSSNALMGMTWISSSSAMLKLLSIIPISLFALGATSAIALTIVVSFVAVFAAMHLTRKVEPGNAIIWDQKSLATIISLTVFWTLTNSDLVAVKVLGTDIEAGYYAAAASLGRVSLILSTIYVQYRFYAFLKEANLSQGRLKLGFSLKSILPVALLGLLLSGIFFTFGHQLVSAIYGSTYSESDTFLAGQALLATLVSINYVLLNFLLILGAKHITSFLVLVTILTSVAYLSTGENAFQKLEILIVANAVLSCFFILRLFASKKSSNISL